MSVPPLSRVSLHDFPAIPSSGGLWLRARLGPTSPWSSEIRLNARSFLMGEGTVELPLKLNDGAAAGTVVEVLNNFQLRISCRDLSLSEWW